MFTRQHYQAIADEIRRAEMAWSTKQEWAGVMAVMFAADNPHFDTEQFLAAAGVEHAPCLTCGEYYPDHLPGCALERSFEAHPAQGSLKVVK